MDINDDAVQTIHNEVSDGSMYREVDKLTFQLQEVDDETEIDDDKIEMDETGQYGLDTDPADEFSDITPSIVADSLYGILGLSTEKFKEKKSKVGICHICKKNYANLYIHTSQMHGNNAKKYTCEICDKVYHSKMGLLYHMEIHADDKPHKCAECDKAFQSKSILKAHVQSAHRKRARLCPICGKCVSCALSLTGHLRMHTGKRPYKCDTCGMTFAYANVLRDHILIHSGEKPFHCEICKKDFRQRSSLTQHVKRVHNGVKNIQCDKCRLKFSNGAYLRQHIKRMHSGKPRVGPCPKCGKYFTEAHTLKRHIEAHDVSTNRCDVCKTHFRSHITLRKHLQAYKGRKPFACGHCEKLFHLKKNAESHVLQQHSTSNVQVTDSSEMNHVEKELKIEILIEGADESGTEESCSEDGQKSDIFDVEDVANTSEQGSSATQYNVNANQTVMDVMDQSLIGKKKAIVILDRLDQYSKDSDNTTALATQEAATSNGENVGFQGTLEENGTIFDLQDSKHFGSSALETNTLCDIENPSAQDRMDTDRVIAPVISSDYNTVHTNSTGSFQMEGIPESTIDSLASCNSLHGIAGNDADSAEKAGGSVPGTSSCFRNPCPRKTKRGRPVQICETCGKETINMKSHKRYCRQKGDTLVNCKTCNKSMLLKKLKYHMLTHREKPFACAICSKTFLRSTVLIKHMRIHSGEKPFQCEFCQTKFRTEQTLKIHIRTHTGERPYPCKICGMRFGHLKVRSDHEKIHTGEKSHVCDVCGKTFTQRSSLRSHWATHTTDKKFECKTCGEKFKRKNDLRQHDRRRHIQREKFKCELCDKEYSEQSSVLKHFRWHEKFPCSICDRRFKTKEELEQHESRPDAKRIVSCGICGRKYHSRVSAKRHIARRHVAGHIDEEKDVAEMRDV